MSRRPVKMVQIELREDEHEEYIASIVPRIGGELTYYLSITEEPMGFGGMNTETERHQIHALSSARAIRLVLRRAKFNDGRFNVGEVKVDRIDR